MTLHIPLKYDVPIGPIGDRAFAHSCSNIRSFSVMQENPTYDPIVATFGIIVENYPL
jgi:hypothetical protein